MVRRFPRCPLVFVASYYYGGPLTLDRLVGLVDLNGGLVLFAIQLGIFLSVLVYRSELGGGIANIRDRGTETEFLTSPLDVPLKSITAIEGTRTGQPSMMTTNWLVIRSYDGGTQEPVTLSFLPGVDGRGKERSNFSRLGVSPFGETSRTRRARDECS